jgi:hypothetical protein
LRKHGKHIPDVAIAGGFVDETQIFKSIALSNFSDNPYVKTIAMARAPLTAVMRTKYFVKMADEGKLPKSFIESYGDQPEKFLICNDEINRKYESHLLREINEL